MALSLHLVPQSLELESSYQTGGECYCAFFNKNGNLLIGCHDGVRLYKENYHKATLRANHVTSIASVNDGTTFLYIPHSDDDRTVKKTFANLLNTQGTVFGYSFPGDNCGHVTASSKFIVAHNSDSLVLFNLATMTRTIEKMNFQTVMLRFESDKNLLITSPKKLYKYNLDSDGNLSLIWICNDMVGASGIAFSKHGFIIVQSTEEKAMYIVSPQG